MFGFSRVIAHGIMRWFELKGIYINAQDRPDVIKQRQDNLRLDR